MGISTDMFVKNFKANSKLKGNAFEDFIQKHIVTQYIPYLKKITYCDLIIKSSCHIQEGNIEIVKINRATQYLFFIMRLIELYTDIEINQEKVWEEFDKLNEIGAIDVLIGSIPKSEYSEFNTLLNMKMDDFIDNEYSLTAFIYNLKKSLNISEDMIDSIIEEIKKQETNSNN